MTVSYELKEFKSILNKYKFIDSWFWCRYSINTYNGCEFACTYCDSRSHKYHLQPEFDQIIHVKKNVKEMLDNRISRARTLLPDVVAVSGTCDPYQPAEKKYKNTRQCLEVLAKHKYPVLIGTKSTLVTRDKDLLAKIANNNWCAVFVTITTTDNKLSKFLEPNAPLPEQRFGTVKELKKVDDLQVGVNLMPIIPFLGDSPEKMEDIVCKTKSAGADYILFAGGMTMRDNQAKWFLDKLSAEYPALVPKYLELYNASLSADVEYKGKYGPSRSYSKKIHKIMFTLCEKYELNYRMKRFIPDDHRKENYIIAGEFLNEAYHEQAMGKPYSNLFWAGQNIQNLKESIRAVADRGELQTIRNVNEALTTRIEKRLDEIEGKNIVQMKLG